MCFFVCFAVVITAVVFCPRVVLSLFSLVIFSDGRIGR